MNHPAPYSSSYTGFLDPRQDSRDPTLQSNPATSKDSPYVNFTNYVRAEWGPTGLSYRSSAPLDASIFNISDVELANRIIKDPSILEKSLDLNPDTNQKAKLLETVRIILETDKIDGIEDISQNPQLLGMILSQVSKLFSTLAPTKGDTVIDIGNLSKPPESDTKLTPPPVPPTDVLQILKNPSLFETILEQLTKVFNSKLTWLALGLGIYLVLYKEVLCDFLVKAIWNDFLVEAIWNDFLVRGIWNDFLVRGIWNDFLVRGIWNDFLVRGIWNDFLIKGIWNDFLVEGIWNDFLVRGIWNDFLVEGIWNDFLVRGIWNDFLSKGFGMIFLSKGFGTISLSKESGMICLSKRFGMRCLFKESGISFLRKYSL